MSDIQQYQHPTPAIKQAMNELDMDLQVGDVFIKMTHYDNQIVRIIGFQEEDEVMWVLSLYALNFEATEWGNGYNGRHDKKFGPYHKHALEDFKKEFLVNEYKHDIHRLERGRSLQDYFAEAKSIMIGEKDINDYRVAIGEGEVNPDRALIHKASKEALAGMQNALEQGRKKVEILRMFVAWELERRKAELSKIKDQLYAVVAEFTKKITRIMRVITTIELYLGIDEELFQLQDGPKAKDTEPIQFRQALLYMDEEVAEWRNGGFDDSDISKFDEWLIANENFKKLLPEPKGMVVFRARRESKYYTDNVWINALMNQKNLGKTYLLIRNGECLYRIYTDKIVILPRLFPQRQELEKMMQKLEEETWRHSEEEKKEKLDDAIYHYKQRAALMQGLIDRSEVFSPMARKISIYKMEENKDLVRFIYDDELLLPTGRLPFWEWVKSINAKVTEGSRILVTGEYDPYRGYYSRKDYEDRFYNRGEHNIPDPPKEGVYVVFTKRSTTTTKFRKSAWDRFQKEHPNGIHKLRNGEQQTYKLIKHNKSWYKWGEDEQGHIDINVWPSTGNKDQYIVEFTEEKGDLVIKYNPQGDVRIGWSYKYRERKNNLSFKIYPDDSFWLNYDQIDLDDVNFYINSRVDRHHYLNMMPILEKIRAERLKEIENEKAFIRFVMDRNTALLGKGEALRRALECVRWWKYRNKWKRPISKDDTLALRMIEKRLQSAQYNTFKKYNNNE